MGASRPHRSEQVEATRRRAVLALCVTEITSWGTLYYSLPVASAEIIAAEPWSPTAVAGAFSAGLLSSAVAGIAVGRWLDHAGPRVVMSAGSALGAIGLVLVAVAPSLQAFVGAWLVVGTAQAAALYQPAFTAIARWYGDDRTRPLTVLTLVAGFASTVFTPITAALATAWGWRPTYLTLAVILAAVTIPLHVFLLTPRWPRPVRRARRRAAHVAPVIRSRRFVILALGMTLLALGLYGVTLNAIALLTSRGVSSPAATAAFALIGVGQVLGRLAFAALPTATTPPTRAMIVGAATATALGLLTALPGPVTALIAAAVLAGAARGAYTLVQATAVADRWGTHRLGTLNGALTAPITAATAIAPATGVFLAARLGSFTAAAACLTATTLVGTLLVRRT